MGEPQRQKEPLPDPEDALIEAEIDEVLAEFNGDVRAAIRALLHDFDMLAAEARAALFRQDQFRRNRRTRG